MIELPDCKVSFDLIVKSEDYLKWCKDFDLVPDEGGYKDYAQQSFLTCVRSHWELLKIEEL